MIVLGVDPGLAHCGWAVVDYAGLRATLRGCGTITTAPHDYYDERARLDYVTVLLRDLVESHRPDAIGIESVEVRRQRGAKINPASLLPIARLLGRVEGLADGGLSVHVVRASDWRKAIGAGHGTDAEVRRAVSLHVQLPARCSVHAVDAIGLALWAGRVAT